MNPGGSVDQSGKKATHSLPARTFISETIKFLCIQSKRLGSRNRVCVRQERQRQLLAMKFETLALELLSAPIVEFALAELTHDPSAYFQSRKTAALRPSRMKPYHHQSAETLAKAAGSIFHRNESHQTTDVPQHSKTISESSFESLPICSLPAAPTSIAPYTALEPQEDLPTDITRKSLSAISPA